MKPTIFMPQTIKAGFRNRQDTFTGKLAYVIYYDEKGKLRKEKSWNNWRQEQLGSKDFDNKPTKGYFINKSTGGHKSGWNFRKSYIRIYDPRGFEFEISVENLIYILEHVDSSAENGLEGEFVYGWDRSELVLIPTNSPDYKEIKEYNEILQNKDNKLKVSDLTVGGTYKDRSNRDYVYVGRKDIWETNPRWKSNYGEGKNERTLHKGKYHTFIKLYQKAGRKKDEEWFDVITVKSPSGRFIQEVSSSKSEDFEKIMKYVNEYFTFNEIDETATELIRLTVKDLYESRINGRTVFVNDAWYFISKSYMKDGIYQISHKVVNNGTSRFNHNRTVTKVLDEGTLEELVERNEIYEMKHYLKNGKEFKY